MQQYCITLRNKIGEHVRDYVAKYENLPPKALYERVNDEIHIYWRDSSPTLDNQVSYYRIADVDEI